MRRAGPPGVAAGVGRVVALASLTTAVLAVTFGLTPRPSAAATHTGPPVLAYYYIWFDPTSWNRAKTDTPLLGRYSSDERSVMEKHVEMAKAAGIDGFIVSWKSTEKLDRRLALLADVAEEHDFKLVVIYQGLDFDRNPIPPSQIASDLDLFVQRFAPRPAFHLFAKPAVILSGSWEYSDADIRALGANRRDQILLLGSEKSPAGVQRLAGLVDGDAYYWSSVNPSTYPRYQEKLDAMSAAVHSTGGIWIAPVAPGFDARLVGGSSTVDRDGGETLATEFAAATSSRPDAVGVISWNEFSENSQIEPSHQHGTEAIATLAGLLGGQAPEVDVGQLDSSEPGERGSGWGQGAAIGSMGLVTVAATGVLLLRQRRARSVAARPTPDFPWLRTAVPWTDPRSAPGPRPDAGAAPGPDRRREQTPDPPHRRRNGERHAP